MLSKTINDTDVIAAAWVSLCGIWLRDRKLLSMVKIKDEKQPQDNYLARPATSTGKQMFWDKEFPKGNRDGEGK